ncbi:MAG: hypothetical protein QOI66_2360 [Myxococcales bacterium]|nr:hypothetical protein [Myxococcales bacterium]
MIQANQITTRLSGHNSHTATRRSERCRHSSEIGAENPANWLMAGRYSKRNASGAAPRSTTEAGHMHAERVRGIA